MPDPPAMTVAELAERLGARVSGDGSRLIRTVATLERAGPDALSWLGSAEYLPKLAKSQAAAVLVPRECAAPAGTTTISVPDPDLALCEALALLAPASEPVPPGVDASATVARGAVVEGAALGAHVFIGARAVVGAGTQLHPGVYVGADATIGRDCVLWPNVVVRERVTLGDRVIVHPNTTIGADGFGYLLRDGRHRKIPQIGTVVVEDDVEIGANCCIDRARSGETRIRRGTKIDNLVQIGHNVEVGEHGIIVAQCGISGSTTLGRQVVLAGQVGVIDHLRIGDRVQVAAQSGVTRDIPEGRAFRGMPAIESRLFARQQAAVRRLPKLVEQVRELTRRIEQLESAADDQERS